MAFGERPRPAPAEEIPDLEPGTGVGQYILETPIGGSGLSKAWIASHRVFRRKAVVVLPRWTVDNEAQFVRWLETVSRLDHPNIIKLFECGEHEGTPYAVLQHVEGKSLAELLDSDLPQDVLTLLRLFRTLAEVLAYCHGQGVAHRDLKAPLVIVDPTGVPFLQGFFIAASIDEPLERRAFAGTPWFMAPELWEFADGPGDACRSLPLAQADVWSFGQLLYRALAGGRMYDHEWDQMEELKADIRSSTPVDLSALRERAPDPVIAFLARCLEKDPADRYPSGRALANAVDALVDDLERSEGSLRDVSLTPGRHLLLHVDAQHADAAGRYWEVRVHERLGSGSYGEVYRVERLHVAGDEAARDDLALKLLRPEYLERPEVVERFRREAKYIAALRSDHVVKLHGFGRLGPALFIAMELLDGQRLRDCMRPEAPASVREAARLGAALTRGLATMHAGGVIHRDLKPENVMLVGPDRRAVIADFGLAMSEGSTRLTATGAFCGTPAYASPEQLGGARATPAVDIYALGVIFYELLSGRRPHVASSVESLIHAVLTRDPEPLRSLRPDLHERVVGFVMSLLRREPEERLTDTSEILDALTDPAFDDDGRPPSLQSLLTR